MTGESAVIGVLGGMGPAATAHFQARLVGLAAADTDADHPTVVTWSDPRVPDRVAALRGTGPSPVPTLRVGLTVLAEAGAEVLAVPCNTVHPFLPEAVDGFALRLVDMIEVTADEAAGAGISAAAVLGTAATLEQGIYQRALAARAVRAQQPEAAGQAAVLELIASVKAGVPVRDLVAGYMTVVDELAGSGHDGVLVGCSEISAVAAAAADAGVAAPVTTVDAVDVLARATLSAAGHASRD